LLAEWDRDITGDLAADLRWQPPLWRALLRRVDAYPPHVRHANTVAELQKSCTDVPQRISLFGHTRLAVTDVELLEALSTHHDVHLWLPHPSERLWQSLTDVHEPIPRRHDTSHRDVRHPLLARHDAIGRPSQTARKAADRRRRACRSCATLPLRWPPSTATSCTAT
jgi:exodeoxyribonuclease V gamma subunit